MYIICYYIERTTILIFRDKGTFIFIYYTQCDATRNILVINTKEKHYFTCVYKKINVHFNMHVYVL